MLLDKHGNKLASYYADVGNGRERRPIPIIADDSRVSCSPWTRRQILAAARYLTSNVGLVRGCVNDLTTYSLGGNGLLPQSTSDKANEYESFWREWCKIADATGRFTFGQMQQMISKRILIDGDCGLLFLNGRGKNKFPSCQIIESHNITSEDKKYYDGVRVNKWGKVVAYSVKDGKRYRKINANDFVLLHEVDRADAYRGISALAHAINNIRDITDILEYEKMSIKLNSAISAVVENDTGSVTDGTAFIESGMGATSSDELSQATWQAGTIPYLKNGDKLNAFGSNRPNNQFVPMLNFLMRDVACGLQIPFEFAINPEKLSGTNSRLILAKAQRRFEQHQQLLIGKCLNRVWAFVIGSAIDSGRLPKSKNWWAVNWQTPKKITVDSGRDANADLNFYKFGMRTLADHASERGLNWLELRTQYETEIMDLMDRAKRIAEKHDVTLEFAVNMLQTRSPNPIIQPVFHEEIKADLEKDENE